MKMQPGSFSRWLFFVYGVGMLGLVALADLAGGLIQWPLIQRIPWGDKLGHVLLFGGLGFCLNLWVASVECLRGKHLLVTVGLLLVVTLEELSQRYLVHRNFDWYDLLANLLGILLFSWLACRVTAWRRESGD
ncbi:VanZ family protein [Verrucomicrobiaceae bacterium N1E253]|uniref:VanZ family protein n=1 Tax=Oceaniferula marina TaxID=2748318 RepID=A0A851GPR1_9BACT|nr:VanZ family protein [Oceaniferula marina]NWK56997.1 VanZ family protein [Oceaniferula marina]